MVQSEAGYSAKCRWPGSIRNVSLRTFPFVLEIVFNAAWLAKPAFPVSYEMLAAAARTRYDDDACLVSVLTEHLGRPCFCTKQQSGWSEHIKPLNDMPG